MSQIQTHQDLKEYHTPHGTASATSPIGRIVTLRIHANSFVRHTKCFGCTYFENT